MYLPPVFSPQCIRPKDGSWDTPLIITVKHKENLAFPSQTTSSLPRAAVNTRNNLAFRSLCLSMSGEYVVIAEYFLLAGRPWTNRLSTWHCWGEDFPSALSWRQGPAQPTIYTPWAQWLARHCHRLSPSLTSAPLPLVLSHPPLQKSCKNKPDPEPVVGHENQRWLVVVSGR